MTFSTANFCNNTIKSSAQRESCNGLSIANGTYTLPATKLHFVLVINGITLHGEAVKR